MAARVRKSHVHPLRQTSRPLATSLDCQQQRCFSSTPVPQISTMRRKMFSWLKGPGAGFRKPRHGTHHYLGAYDRNWKLKPTDNTRDSGAALRPFPANPYFKSEPVLSEPLREEIYRRVVEENKTVREVSNALNVTMERVGAVVRLKTMEQEWLRQGKTPNNHYQQTVLGMLPQTAWSKDGKNQRHESINDLPVHSATLTQIFHPTSESRQFTRVDAGQVFQPFLLPADSRIPHPETIERYKDLAAGYRRHEVETREKDRIEAIEAKRKEDERKAKERESNRTRVVEGTRWDFKFKDVSVDDVGKDGRARAGVGWRYGAPLLDRKKGQVKIPTRVD